MGFVGGTDSGRGEERMGGSCCLLHSFTPTYLQEYICVVVRSTILREIAGCPRVCSFEKRSGLLSKHTALGEL